MTQWLIEEAAFVALDLDDARLRHEVSEEHQAEQNLLDRHAELVKMREAARAVV